ncbi:MAG: 4-(cytidine 5'-diphospho)-2-C-methyl-D-erythritol kinase [Candidatus Latescibacterota bacterium]|nr:MAG: 4-(cytidine 5'-diphospho)-2-C-methyl-D-erythritol kinase [Candidatus Latescibacterota bacterium]
MKTPDDPRRFDVRARAKVNLALEILRKRRDGYHEIETILQSIELYDRLDIEINRSGRVVITCSDPDIPTDESNLCHRAIEKMRPHIGDDLGAVIHIEKHIPPNAGLGGGSSDAAAAILAAARASGLDLSPAQLEGVAAEVGSDVPFMLYGGTMFARGRGELLTKLTPLRRGNFLIVKPPVDISTAWAYKNVNFQLTKHRYRFNLKAVNALLARFPDVTLSFRNALEDVVCPSYPLVYEVLEELLASRPYVASMSGSGSAIFAIYESEARASQLAERFSVRGFFTAVAKPSPRAVDLNPAEAR